MTVENTKSGVRVKETSDDAFTAQLIKAHADVVSKFVEGGFEKAEQSHAVPSFDAEKSKELQAEDRAKASEGMRPALLKAVFHINFSDSDRQMHGLKNVTNILKEEAGAEIEVVCHGGGIALLVMDTTDHAGDVARLIAAGVRFVACENTLRDKSISRENLLPNVTTVASGAVEVLRKQQEGFGYFKP